MKKALAASLIALPLLSLSSMAFAAEPDAHEPMPLSAAQMDDVTAGGRYDAGRGSLAGHGFWRPFPAVYKRAEISQINISPVVIIQIGNNNTAIVYSGNFASIFQ
ncbi:hypothetical protein [Noviherbaspirillum sp.]|jgi:hypothetical protein|uniref:hypothetical protein n=1 Tax=Noviherbaspirillum sp. TaxID=1926288 RepID=UPI0025D47F2F|nr:hypothetical protein [Noviherbaspirillum sp.]